MISDYYHLTKPGIVRGNAMTAAAGLFLASKGSINFGILFGAITGLSLVIASACVFNNYIDRDIDIKMERTKKRALVTGKISTTKALIYATLLLLSGEAFLLIYSNALAAFVALFGFFAYVVLYGYFKRKSVYGTEVGSISGAVPPVVGYVAVTGSFDTAALLLFLILTFWQMPHFYAIGIFRGKDYKAANIPIMSLKRGLDVTKTRIMIYVLLFTLTAPLLTVFDYTGYIYLAVMLTLSGVWILKGLKGYNTKSANKWAGEMFGYSLIILTVFSVMISLNAWLT